MQSQFLVELFGGINRSIYSKGQSFKSATWLDGINHNHGSCYAPAKSGGLAAPYLVMNWCYSHSQSQLP